MPIRRFVLVLVLMLAPALGGAATPEDAVAAVKKTLDAPLEIARAGGTRDEKLASLRAVARDILDTRAMGRRAIGDVLAAQPPEQQAEYLELFDRGDRPRVPPEAPAVPRSPLRLRRAPNARAPCRDRRDHDRHDHGRLPRRLRDAGARRPLGRDRRDRRGHQLDRELPRTVREPAARPQLRGAARSHAHARRARSGEEPT